MNSRRVTFPVLISLAASCGRPAPASTPVALKPCDVTGVMTVDTSWRQVHGSGFTFCVQGSWRPSSGGAREWVGDEGRVTWGAGRPASLVGSKQVFTTTTTVVTQQAGQLPPSPTPAPVPTDASQKACGQPATQAYVVGAVSMLVTQVDCHGTWTETAWSTTPPIYVQGVAQGSSATVLLAAMMATIRFTNQ